MNYRFVKILNKLEKTGKTDRGVRLILIQLPSQHHCSGLRITSRRSLEGWSINHPKRINSQNLVSIIDYTVHLATAVIVPWGREFYPAECFQCLVVTCIYREKTAHKRPCKKTWGNCFLNPFYDSQPFHTILYIPWMRKIIEFDLRIFIKILRPKIELPLG